MPYNGGGYRLDARLDCGSLFYFATRYHEGKFLLMLVYNTKEIWNSTVCQLDKNEAYGIQKVKNED